MTSAIELQGLTRSFGDFVAVDHLDLRVPKGALYGFLGLNGAGKSTTIKMLTTLLAPTGGTARVAGHHVVADPISVRASIGLVGDEGAEACGSWSPREYMGYFAGLRGIPQARARVESLLATVGIAEPWRGRALSRHSTGMKRRVEIARALLGEPQVLFLDEPTRGLDVAAKRETWDLCRSLAAEGTTIFVSSHEILEIQALCEHLAVIASGKLTYEGPAVRLGRDPAAFEAALIRLLQPRISFEMASKSSSAEAR
jgi:ABC-2 type transport system ATP-binding protein